MKLLSHLSVQNLLQIFVLLLARKIQEVVPPAVNTSQLIANLKNLCCKGNIVWAKVGSNVNDPKLIYWSRRFNSTNNS
jgi:hypothetical protein